MYIKSNKDNDGLLWDNFIWEFVMKKCERKTFLYQFFIIMRIIDTLIKIYIINYSYYHHLMEQSNGLEI